MEKQSAVIYGLGRRFYSNHFIDNILPIIEDEFMVRGVSDRRPPNSCPNIGDGYIENSLIRKSDVVIITSDVYFNEIKDELKKKGINKILSIDDIERDYVSTVIPFDMFRNLRGVEIGGPSYIFKYLYQIVGKCDGVNFCENTVWWKRNEEKYAYGKIELGEIMIADAVDLSLIENHFYDFYISSNNLEHIANPLKALLEAKRILKNGGIILLVVPKKELCFDHSREITSLEHIINDFEREIEEDDLSHLDEIIKHHDFEMDSGVNSIDEFKERSLKNYYNRCLHHHVFDEELLIEIFHYMNFNIVSSGVIFDNYFILGKI